MWFRDLFAKARDRGLRLTCHAGETTGPVGMGRWRLERSASATASAAVEDLRLVEHLRERGIPLEVCRDQQMSAPERSHPCASIRCGACSTLVHRSCEHDDPVLFGCTLASEYELVAREFGFSEDELDQLAANARRYAFSGPTLAANL